MQNLFDACFLSIYFVGGAFVDTEGRGPSNELKSKQLSHLIATLAGLLEDPNLVPSARSLLTIPVSLDPAPSLGLRTCGMHINTQKCL